MPGNAHTLQPRRYSDGHHSAFPQCFRAPTRTTTGAAGRFALDQHLSFGLDFPGARQSA